MTGRWKQIIPDDVPSDKSQPSSGDKDREGKPLDAEAHWFAWRNRFPEAPPYEVWIAAHHAGMEAARSALPEIQPLTGDTPRTDALHRSLPMSGAFGVADAYNKMLQHASQLERELAAAMNGLASIAEGECITPLSASGESEVGPVSEAELDAARVELAPTVSTSGLPEPVVAAANRLLKCEREQAEGRFVPPFESWDQKRERSRRAAAQSAAIINARFNVAEAVLDAMNAPPAVTVSAIQPSTKEKS